MKQTYLGISNNIGNIKVGYNSVPGTGTSKNRGNVYFYTNKSNDGRVIPVKAKVQKLSAEHADILWTALQLSKTSGKGMNGLATPWPTATDPRVQGLTVGQVIAMLTNWGEPKTSLDFGNNSTFLGEHLRQKQLFISRKDPSVKKASSANPYMLTFGSNKIMLFGPKETSQAEKEAFIKWATENKNYAVNLRLKTLGLELNQPINKSFKIGAWEYKKESRLRYSDFLINNNVVMTDVALVEITNEDGSKTKLQTVFQAPLLSFSNSSDDREIVGGRNKAEAAKKTAAFEDMTPAEKKTKTILKVKQNQELNTEELIASLPVHSEIWYEGGGFNDEGVLESEQRLIGKVVLVNGIPTFRLVKVDLDPKTSLLPGADGKPLTQAAKAILLEGRGAIGPFYASIKEVEEKKEVVKPAPKPVVTPVANEDTQLRELGYTEDQIKGMTSEEKSSISTMGLVNPISEPKIETHLSDGTKPEGDTSDRIPFDGEDGAPRETKVPTPVKYKVQDIEKEINRWLVSIFGRDYVNKNVKFSEALIKIGNSENWGSFSKDIITLYKLAETGTAYHEAYHRVSLMFLSPDERTRMYNEARIKYKKELLKEYGRT